MSKITLYGYAKCSTCKKAQKWLDAREVEYTFVDITLKPPGQALLRKIVSGGDYGLKQLYNTSGQVYRGEGWKEKRETLSEKEQLAALAGNGRLIKRPIVSDGTRFTVGFKEDRFEEVWG